MNFFSSFTFLFIWDNPSRCVWRRGRDMRQKQVKHREDFLTPPPHIGIFFGKITPSVFLRLKGTFLTQMMFLVMFFHWMNVLKVLYYVYNDYGFRFRSFYLPSLHQRISLRIPPPLVFGAKRRKNFGPSEK